jgi:hypothetical protein
MTTPTNPYYQRRFSATGGQLARAASVLSEFQLIQRGFDLIGAQNAVIKFQLSCSDLVSDLVVGPRRAYFRTTDAFTLLEVRASVLEASTLGSVRVGLTINGFNALFSPIQIDEGQKTSVTSVRPPSIAYQNLPDDSEVVIDLLTAGSGAKGLIVSMMGVRVAEEDESL